MSTSVKEKWITVIQHELGHWFMSRSVGFSTGNLKVDIDSEKCLGGSCDCFPVLDISSLDKFREYLERRTAVLYAGTMSELLFWTPRKGISLSDRSEHLLSKGSASDDGVKAFELEILLRNIRFSGSLSSHLEIEQRQEIRNDIWAKYAPNIEKQKDDIEWLAQHFYAEKQESSNAIYKTTEEIVNLLPSRNSASRDTGEI